MPELDRDPLLRDVFDIPEVVAASDYVLQLHTGVDQAERTAAQYVATPSLARAFDDALGYVAAALSGGSAQGVFLHGSFGSGKSHFMAVLDLMLRGEPAAKAIPGLQQVVAQHSGVLERRLLTVEYHLIGATSLEDALFSGFTRRLAAVHPEATPPLLHRSDRLFADAAGLRAVDEAGFLARLNAGRGSGSDGWGTYDGPWTSETYDRAVAAAPDDDDRTRLARDLIRTIFTGYTQAGQWLDLADGLDVMTRTVKDLGYDGLVLFLDELVLWLASHASNASFVSGEASKVAKLVETGVGQRAVPLVSFVARQRELSDFVGDKTAGVQRAQVGQAIQYWEDRFDTITLAASNLPDVAQKRLLTPTSPQAAARIQAAVAAVKASTSWDVLLDDDAGSGEEAFAKVYPFSPALVDVLVALSGRLQRERTALKVMAQLLSSRRDTGRISQVVGVGDLYDVMIAEGEQPLSHEMRQLFDVARTLYDTKFVPALLAGHGLASLSEAGAEHPVRKDARLAKTLLVAALVPEVRSLSRLTARRLAALNHGTVQAWIPGEEASQVLATVRAWNQQIGEIHIGEGHDPTIAVELSGVDYESVLARVENEDTMGARRTLLRRLLFDELGIPEVSQLSFGGLTVTRVWRGTRRTIEVVFGNIRDTTAIPDAALLADGDRWKLVVDYPFDDGDHGPQEDVNRLHSLRVSPLQSRTVGWVPYFLTAARLEDLGTLVLLEHLLGGGGGQFDQNAAHLPVEQRALARQNLDSRRRALTETIRSSLRQAYGIVPGRDADIDRVGYGEITPLPTLWQEQPLQRPAGATLSAALDNVIDQMLSLQFPDHPVIERGAEEVRSGDLRAMWEVVSTAAAAGGRLDPVPQNRRAVVRRLAGPLRLGYVGDAHYVFDQATVGWHRMIVQRAAAEDCSSAIPVASLRSWLAPIGLTRDMGNLVVACFALLEDKQFQVHGGPVEVREPADIRDDMTLVDPRLPSERDWDVARDRAGVLFGITTGQRRTVANVTALGRQLAGAARERLGPCRSLVDLLDAHGDTLALAITAPRRTTAAAGMTLVEALAAADDDVTRVEVLAARQVPPEPQPLATSMASAHDLVQGIGRRDWTTLDAVAQYAAAGEDGAAAAVVDLRKTAAAEELHAKLLPQLDEAQRRATGWLVSRPRPEPPPDPAPAPGPPPGSTAPQGEPSPELALTVTDPDTVTLDVDQSSLDEQLRSVHDDVAAALRQHPGTRVRITWRLL